MENLNILQNNNVFQAENVENQAVITAETLVKDIAKRSKKKHTTPKPSGILAGILDHVKWVDFAKEAFGELPEGEEKPKLNMRHYRIICVENLLEIIHQNKLGLARKNGKAFIYNGQFWQPLEDEQLQDFLGDVLAKMGKGSDSVAKFLARDYAVKDQLLKQFYADARLGEIEGEGSEVKINLLNGTFVVKPNGRELSGFLRNDFLTHQLPFAYDPKAKAPIFQRYLDRVLPDQSAQNVLAEYIAYTFTKHLKLEKALILYGSGANGKSVFFEVISGLLGHENISNYSAESLTNGSGYQRAMIGQKLLNYASEISTHLEPTVFKQLVSGEPIEARLPYGQPFILRDYAKFIFNCNELPTDTEQTHAFFRRFLIVPFQVQIPENERDTTLAARIVDHELAGVFNWVLAGLDRLLKNERFTECEASKQALAEYQVVSDSVKLFAAEHELKPDYSKEIPLKDVFARYKDFCGQNIYKPCSNRTFTKRLESLGITKKRANYGFVLNASIVSPL